MASGDPLARALELFQKAFEAQLRGDLDEAVALYRRSIDARPTAEAHTFLGWTYSFRGDLEAAIEECKLAIAVDPSLGNPYNDIGAYLIEMGRPGDALPWLEKATVAPRYEARHFPHFNMGRAYVALEMYGRALAEFDKAHKISPDHAASRQAAEALRRKLN